MSSSTRRDTAPRHNTLRRRRRSSPQPKCGWRNPQHRESRPLWRREPCRPQRKLQRRPVNRFSCRWANKRRHVQPQRPPRRRSSLKSLPKGKRKYPYSPAWPSSLRSRFKRAPNLRKRPFSGPPQPAQTNRCAMLRRHRSRSRLWRRNPDSKLRCRRSGPCRPKRWRHERLPRSTTLHLHKHRRRCSDLQSPQQPFSNPSPASTRRARHRLWRHRNIERCSK